MIVLIEQDRSRCRSELPARLEGALEWEEVSVIHHPYTSTPEWIPRHDLGAFELTWGFVENRTAFMGAGIPQHQCGVIYPSGVKKRSRFMTITTRKFEIE